MKKHYKHLCFIVDNAVSNQKIRSAIHGGITMLQVRDKDACHDKLKARVSELRDIIGGHGVKIIVNDVPVSSADGIHLGQRDMDPIRARALLGPDAIIGLTIDTQNDVLDAIDQHRKMHLDYLSPVIYQSISKPTDPEHIIGEEGLEPLVAKLSHVSRRPAIIAIGGLDKENIPSIIQHGADGVAVIGAIKNSEDPLLSTQMLRRAVGF